MHLLIVYLLKISLAGANVMKFSNIFYENIQCTIISESMIKTY